MNETESGLSTDYPSSQGERLRAELEAMLRPAERPEQSGPSRADFNAHAQDVLTTLTTYRQERGLSRSQAIALVEENYGSEAEDLDPSLVELTGILIQIPDYHAATVRAERVKLSAHTRPLSNAEKTQFHADKYFACGMNRQLIDMAHQHPGTFTRQDLKNWLAKGSSSNLTWASTISQGIASEVAVTRALQLHPRIADVELPTIEDDMRGVDVIVRSDADKTYALDVKSGHAQLGSGGLSAVNGKVELGVASADVQEDFTLSRVGQAKLVMAVDQLIK